MPGVFTFFLAEDGCKGAGARIKGGHAKANRLEKTSLEELGVFREIRDEKNCLMLI
jgi:hypothetical protein